MCKLFILTNTKGLTTKQLRATLRATTDDMTLTEGDGFGWMAHSSDGIFGERYLDIENIKFPIFSDITSGQNDAQIFKQEYARFGKPGVPTGGLLVHARTSTNEVSLANTHPFIGEKLGLIHNGVVSSAGKKIKTTTNCDTELCLAHYERGGIAEMSRSLEGYYALGIMDKASGAITVVKDSTASLHGAWIEKFKTYAFATSPDTIEAFFKALKCDGKIARCDDNFEWRFNPDGAFVARQSFNPNKRSYGALDDRSLGHSAADIDYRNGDWSWDRKKNKWKKDGVIVPTPASAYISPRADEGNRHFEEKGGDALGARFFRDGKDHLSDDEMALTTMEHDDPLPSRHESLSYFDMRGRPITENEFNLMPVDEQLSCEIFDGAMRVG